MTPITLEGQTIGKYHILEPLGRGGMAQVYRAYHPQLDRYVAIKILRSDLVEEEEFLARFRREARAVAALRHPNIVQVYDFDVEDEVYYMVMELLEGDTLKAYLNGYRTRNEAVPVAEVARIITDVLDGLAYAHSEGIIHRDLKPANVLLTRKNEAVITDFGIAQIVGGTNYTVSGALMGTLHYMAPEQGMGRNVDHRSDIYSLGIVLYEMLTGHPPFDADTPLAILLKHLNDPLPIPHKPERVIPAPFERVVLKALEKRPEDRYQSADEMSAAVREAAEASQSEVQNQRQPATVRALDNAPTVFEAPSVAPSGSASSLPAEEAPAVDAQPPEAPAVYSGTARQRIADRQFADDDTDLNLGSSLGADALQAEPHAADLPFIEPPQSLILAGPDGDDLAAEKDEEPFSPEKLSSAFTTFATAVGGVLTTAISAAAEGVSETTPALKPVLADLVSENGDIQIRDTKSISVGRAVWIGVGSIVGINLLGVYVGTAFQSWALFQYGWPAELLVVALFLSLLMNAVSEIWMLVPVGILFANGLLFGFSSITGAWALWGLCWPLEPLAVIASIGIPLHLSKKPDRAERLARSLGIAVALFSGLAIGILGLGSLISGAIHLVIH